jgi:hypothetical protein
MTPLDFAHALLRRLGMPESDSNLQALVAVQAIEGGHMANGAQFNPLNTMQGAPGARDAGLKVRGIKAYSSWDEGLEATAQTLLSTKFDYSGILRALRRSAPPDETVRAWGESPWGWTKDASGKVGRATTYFSYYAHKEFPGGGGFGFLSSLPSPVEALKELFSKPSSPKNLTVALVLGAGAFAGILMLVYGLKSKRVARAKLRVGE